MSSFLSAAGSTPARDGPRQADESRPRGLHDQIPVEGPALGSDARRRVLRPQGRRLSSESQLHEIEIAAEIVELLPRMVDMLDEPIGDPAAINTLLMCEAARERGRQGAPIRDGRGRALRRLPQAPGLPDGCRYRRLPNGLRHVHAAISRPDAGDRRSAAACVTRAGPSAS